MGSGLVLLLVWPWLWPHSRAVSLGCQIGVAILACQSYGLLLGRVGLLSFGHAVYTGAGAYAAVLAMRSYGSGGLELPVPLVPLWSAVVAGVLAAGLGRWCVRHGGMPFAMITLGLGELVAALAMMWPEASGGESGLPVDRGSGPSWGAMTFGPVRQVYVLIVLYGALATWALHRLNGTVTGLLWSLTRENPERAGFLGHDPVRQRHRAFIVAGALAGLAGGLSAIVFEIATPEVFSPHRSALYLVFVVLGGMAHLAGHTLGGVIMVLAMVWLSEWTPAWSLWVGLAFVSVVLVAPGGVWGQWQALWARKEVTLAGPGGLRSWLTTGLGLAAWICWGLGIETLYRWRWAEASPAEGSAADLGTGSLSWLLSMPPWVMVGVAIVLTGLWRWRRHRPDPIGVGWQEASVPGTIPLPWAAGLRTEDAPSDQTSAVGLRVDGLRLCRGGIDILKGIDLEVRPGECLAIIGPNGAGKTSLFQVLSGAWSASGGEVRLAGQRIEGGSPVQVRRAGLARSFQVSRLFMGLSVQDHLRAALLGEPSNPADSPRARCSSWQEQARRLMHAVGLDGLRDIPAGQLTYAQQRALDVTMALAGRAGIVLLDEPTAGMSRQETATWLPVLRQLVRGRTLVIIEHDMNVVFGLADRVAVLVDGRVLACDVPEAIRQHPGVRAAYLSTPVRDPMDTSSSEGPAHDGA